MALNKEKYSGMLKHPYEGLSKNPNRIKSTGKKRQKKKGNGSVTSTRGLSPYQQKTQEEFLKVREGETKEQWLHRTRFRRIRSDAELAMTPGGRKELEKVKILQKRKKAKQIELKVKDKDFNFLKYYVFIINWAVIKYNIPQTDLEIGFHFYENLHFTKDQFINKCLLFHNTSTNIFRRFLKEGYIRETLSYMNEGKEKKPTGLYKLSPRFVNIITDVYNKIAYQSVFIYKPSEMKLPFPPEMEKMLNEMAQENADIISGKKEPDKFIIHKEQL